LSFDEAVDLTAAWYARRATEPAFDAGAAMAEQVALYEARATAPAERALPAAAAGVPS
jgi:hypothetical protein